MKLKGQLRWHARPIAMTVLVAVLGLSLWAALGPRPAPVGVALDIIPYYSLPFGPDDPVVSLQEGSTALVYACEISERVGAQVWLKI